MSAASMVKGGVIAGLGRAGQIHLRNAWQWKGAQLLYGMDPNRKLTETLVLPETCKVTGSLDEALADPRVDFVVMATPTGLHYDMILRSLKAGKHVFAEKPLCLEAAEAGPLFEAAAERDLLLFTAYNRRYDPQMQEMRRRVQSGELGRALSVTVVSRDWPFPPAEYLRGAGSIYRDCVVHDLDALAWLLGEYPVRAEARATPSTMAGCEGVWDNSTLRLDFPSGAVATVVTSRHAECYDQRWEVFCERGSVTVSNPPVARPITFTERYADSYVVEINAFLQQLHAKDHTPNLSASHTLWLDNIVKTCEASAEQGGKSLACDTPAQQAINKLQLNRPLGRTAAEA